MEALAQAIGPAVTWFIVPFAVGAVVLIPFAAFIFVARKVQDHKMQTLLKEFDNV